METTGFTEKESLETITRIITETRKNISPSTGKVFLWYGYTSVACSIIVSLTVWLTGNHAWHMLWFLMFVPMAVSTAVQMRRPDPVTTYFDRMIGDTWKIIAVMMVLQTLVIGFAGLKSGEYSFFLMMPLALLFVSIGTLITGLVIGEKTITVSAIAGFIIPLLMLLDTVSGNGPDILWNIMAGLSFILTLVVPGHIIYFRTSHERA